MTPSPTTGTTQRSVFIDTNALIRLFTFWEGCREAELGLDEARDWRTLKSALTNSGSLAGAIDGRAADDLKIGLRFFSHLRNANTECRYFSSVACRSEFHHLLLEWVAIERQAKRRVPRSMRARRPQIFHRIALQDSDYISISGRVNQFFDELRQDHGIDIVAVEEQLHGEAVRLDDIWRTAQEVWSRVLMDVMDGYIYAVAVEIEADVFVTTDMSLRDALKRLHQPGQMWRDLVVSLNNALARSPESGFPEPQAPGVALL